MPKNNKQKKIIGFLLHTYKWSKNFFAIFGFLFFVSTICALTILLSVESIISDVDVEDINSSTTIIYNFEDNIVEDSNNIS